MANFIENLRKATANFVNKQIQSQKEATNNTKVNPVSTNRVTNNSSKKAQNKVWNYKAIQKALSDREANNETAAVYTSMDVEIPNTYNVNRIKTGKLKVDNDVNKTGINSDGVLYIVGNTYQDNEDGSYHGMGWDGRPYSYKIEGNTIKDFTPLGTDEQKKVINQVSDGKITVGENINNSNSLAQIYRSIKRMKDSDTGLVVDTNIVIDDDNPNEWNSDNSIGGWFEEPDSIKLVSTGLPSLMASDVSDAVESGHNAGTYSGYDNIPTHELAHAADFSSGRSKVYDLRKRAEEDKDKYSTGDIFRYNLQMFPALVDKIFGTELADYEMPTSIGEQEEQLADELSNRMNKKGGDLTTESIFQQAARNTGYDNVDDAMLSISKYAGTSETEAFAEAYTDVLLNGNKAKPFSRELVRLYSAAADEISKATGSKRQANIADIANSYADLEMNNRSSDARERFYNLTQKNNPFRSK